MGEATFTLPAAVLRQDAVVIDEQENHIVMTMRLPIDLIRNNHTTLMALSEIATGEPRRSAGPEPPESVAPKRTPHWVYGSLILFGFLLPSPFYACSFASYGPPVEYQSIAMAKPAFKVGENIDIVFRYRRDRICQTSFDRMVRIRLDETPVYSERVYGVSTPVTSEWQTFHLVLRPLLPLEPGTYFYSGLTHSECAKGGGYDLQHPLLAFTIVD